MTVSMPDVGQIVDEGAPPSPEGAAESEKASNAAGYDPDPDHRHPAQFPGDGAPWRSTL